MALLGIPKKINRAYREIEIYESKLDNNKYSEAEHHKYDNKLSEERHTLKNLIKAYNWIYKLYCGRTNKPYVKKSFPPPEKEEIIPTKSESVYVPIKKERIDPRIEILSKEKKKEVKSLTHNFENDFDKIALPKKAFTDDLKLKSKYAKKLFDEKKILLHPEHYLEEDIKKYFYRKSGTGIGSRDAQKLISLGYKPEMKSIGDYELDPELSIDRARVYKNNKTGKAYVVHRGTHEASDWLNNLVYGLSPSLYRYTQRYKTAKDVQEKALNKYGDNVDVIGHSQGAKLAEMLSRGDKRVKDVITYNRPVGLKEAMTPLDKNVIDVRSSYDPVSALAPYQKGNKPVTIENKAWNPLEQHNTKSLLETPNFEIGNSQGEGLVKRKPHNQPIDIVQSVVFLKPSWDSKNSKKWLRDHGFYSDERHDKPSQIRYRQYNPEDLKDRHFISKKLKDEEIILIISKMNGKGFMINNKEILSPEEQKASEYKKYFEAHSKYQKEQERMNKEKENILKTVKMATKTRLAKGSQEMKDKMASIRAKKKK